MGDMAERLALSGHEVRVVTAPPYYPEWRIRAGFRGFWYSYEKWRGVSVWRAPLFVPLKPTGLTRLVHLGSFAIASLPLLLRQAFWQPHVVFVVEPPLFCSPAALVLAKLVGARSWLHVQDFEVDACFELNLLKGDLLKKIVLGFEGWLLSKFDRVSSISTSMVRLARSKVAGLTEVSALPNWVDLDKIQPLNRPSFFREELGIPEHQIVALYSGNMGVKHGLDTLADAIVLLHEHPNLIFVLSGTGVAREKLMLRCQGFANVRFIDLQPEEKLGELLGLADIHLLPQMAGAADFMLPSKLTGMLESGRPVVTTALLTTDLGRLVQGLGVVVEPENPKALSVAILELAADADRRKRLGSAARAFAEANLGHETVLCAFERDLSALVQPRERSNSTASP